MNRHPQILTILHQIAIDRKWCSPGLESKIFNTFDIELDPFTYQIVVECKIKRNEIQQYCDYVSNFMDVRNLTSVKKDELHKMDKLFMERLVEELSKRVSLPFKLKAWFYTTPFSLDEKLNTLQVDIHPVY